MSDDVPTAAVCRECGKSAHKGGPIRPDEQMVRDQWGAWCAFWGGDETAPAWSWCATWRKFWPVA
jgi:hypothetical protein